MKASLCIFSILFILTLGAHGQPYDISGQSVVYVGETAPYAYPGYDELPAPKWVTPTGEVRALRRFDTNTYVINITWTTPGEFTLIFKTSEGTLATKHITILTPCTVGVPTNRIGATRCGAGPVTLSASPGANGSEVRWFNSAGTLVNNSPTYSLTLESTTTFTVKTFDPVTSCYSNGASITGTINIATPPGKVGSTTANDCGSTRFTLRVFIIDTDLSEYRWYDAPEGGAVLGNGNTYLTPVIQNTRSYYVSRYDDNLGCESTRKEIIATVLRAPDAPTVSGNIQFGGQVTAITATGAPEGGTYYWYSPTNLTTPVVEGDTYTTQPIATDKPDYVYVSAVSIFGTRTCESAKVPVSVSVIPLPVITANSWYIAKVEPVTLSCTPTIYDSYAWKDSHGAVVSSTREFRTNKTGAYTLTVTKHGKSYTTEPVTLRRQFDDLDMNYIVTNTFQTGNAQHFVLIDALPVDSVAQRIQYFNGFGMLAQTTGTQASPTKRDIVQPTLYNEFGVEQRKYLPYTSEENNGRYKNNVLSKQLEFYSTSGDMIVDDAKPYAESIFETDPLHQVVKQGAAGEAWQPNTTRSYAANDKTVRSSREFNAANEVLYLDYVYPNASYPMGTITQGNTVYYAARQLYKNSTKDEQGNETIEFSDMQGQVLLKKVQLNATDVALTYYVYDDFGNVVVVLQPEGSKALPQALAQNASLDPLLANYAFHYTYDGRRRMTQKKVPGAGVTYMVYDKRDRLVLTQDANQRAGAANVAKYWSFTKYDELDRPILTGIKDTTTAGELTQAQMQQVVDDFYALRATTKPWRAYGEKYIGNVATHVYGYSNNSYPQVTTGASLDAGRYLTVSYYDNYTFKTLLRATAFNFSPQELPPNTAQGAAGQVTQENIAVNGLLTGTRVRLLQDKTFFNSVTYYDNKYNLVQQIADNVKGHTVTTNVYDFTGKVLRTKTALYTGQPGDWRLTYVEYNNDILVGLNVSGWGQRASTRQEIPANTDGWVEATIIDTSPAIFGLDESTAARPSYYGVNHAWKVSGTSLSVVEMGIEVWSGGTVFPGDVLRVERVDNIVYYKRNGIVLATSAQSFTGIVMMSVVLSSNGTPRIGQPRLSNTFDVPAPFAPTSSFVKRFTYDHAGRLLDIWHRVDTRPEILLSHATYNELGQVVDKKLHSTVASASDAKQSVDFRYNIRGWLTSINNAELAENATNDDAGDLFGMTLGYNNDIGTSNTSGLQYNGNISAIKWSNNQGLGSIKAMGYNYTYDAGNRLTDATSLQATALNTWTPGEYDENSLRYDLNGNIKTLKRKGKGNVAIDHLTYDYGSLGNQLLAVTDAVAGVNRLRGFSDADTSGDDYSYDPNGNMIRDGNKGISITYNQLNLPVQVVRDANDITYSYDAAGGKHAEVVTYNGPQKLTQYVGPWIFENNALQFVQHDEGRVVVPDKNLVYRTGFDDTADVTPTNDITLTNETINGETYIKVTSTTGARIDRLGIHAIGGVFPVQEGERYLFRVKGYVPYSPASLYVMGNNNQDLVWRGSRLLKSAAHEIWVENLIVIPAGVTEISLGVLFWGNTTDSYAYYLNDAELYRVGSAELEYQYHLKDHLGSVWLTFTAKEDTDESAATMETENANDERGAFLYYDEAVKINHVLWDHSSDGATPYTTHYATRLTGGNTQERYGLTKTLSVKPGDRVSLEVFAKYLDPESSHWTPALNNLISAIAAGTAPTGTFVDGGTPGSIGTGGYPISGIDHSADGNGAPKAYLNYILFDEDQTTVLDYGFRQITTAAREYGQDGAHERLAFDGAQEILIGDPGYLYVYLSNENPTAVEVYFDDFRVKHIKSPVVQVNGYYPFGLSYNSYLRENAAHNDFLYNSKEIQTDLGLGWYDYGARTYMPDIARWGVIDPLADKMRRWSPCNYVFNNPVRFIDPDGMGPTGPGYGHAYGGHPLNLFAREMGTYFQAIGAGIDNVGAKIEAFFSFGSEAETAVGDAKVNLANETRTTFTIGTSARDFFTPTADNGSVAPFPGEFSIKTTNEIKLTVSGKVTVEGVDIHTKTVTSKDTSTGEGNKTTTVTVGKNQTGGFVESGTNGTKVGVRTEHKVSTPTGFFFKWGGSAYVGSDGSSSAND